MTGSKITNDKNNKNEKKKINYLNVISQNICENRQTLNNPGEFYAGFFANIIEKQKSFGKNTKKILKSNKNLNFKENIFDYKKTDSKNTNTFYELKNKSARKRNSTDIIEG